MTNRAIPFGIEQLAPGVTFEWILNGKAFILTSLDSTRPTVDAWMTRVTALIHDWPTDQPVLLAIDATAPNVAQTPYQRARLRELRSMRSELKWYMAFLPPKTYVMSLMQMGAKLSTGRRQVRIFFERDKAVDWLAMQPK